MAILYPDIQTINNFKVHPTEGELYILNFLKDNLNDDYEIFFQPFINGDRPDIVVLRKNAGMIIIEVKDWNLDSYKITENGDRKVNGSIIDSPIKQVEKYKEHLFDLHIPGLLEKKLTDVKIFNTIKPVVYFHKESQKRLDDFLKEDKSSAYAKGYVKAYGSDSVSLEKFLLSPSHINPLFDEDIYNYLKRFLQPPLHMIEDGKTINYTNKQKELIESRPGQQKIKGVAGSGKTLVLARRAVKAHIRTKKRVLILTFNISLKNYIHDNISDVRENFAWDNFYIINYHQFIKLEANNLGVRLSKYSFDNEDIFENVKDQIQKFDAIFIDEVQDYTTPRLIIIKKYFLNAGGEFVVFGDEKQNIYARRLDKEKFPSTTIPGGWNILTESYRLSGKIAKLAYEFQEKFFGNKYNLEKINVIQENLFANPKIEHMIFPKPMPIELSLEKIYEFISQNNIHPNNICFLSSEVEVLREFDFLIRTEKKEKTITTFETKERFEKDKDKPILSFILEEIRRNKKLHFWMNPGTVKLSTIHSFKGREIPTLFLIINNSDTSENTDELIYTAITRCRENLVVINIENQRYTDFFNTYIHNADQNKAILLEEIKDKKQEVVGKSFDTLEKEAKKNYMKIILQYLKDRKDKPYSIYIIGETTEKKNVVQQEIGSYFSKYGVSPMERNIEFITNSDIKNTDILKKLKKGRSSYDLVIMGQLYNHSTKGNKCANMLTELEKEEYIPHVVGRGPKKILTIESLLSALDTYLQEQMKKYRLVN